MTGVQTCALPISVGFGLGGVSGKGEAAGSGGGLTVEPIAFIVVQDGNTKIVNLTQNKDLIGKVIDLVPEVVSMLKRDGDKKSE